MSADELTLAVLEPGTAVAAEGEALVLRRHGREVRRVRTQGLRRVLLVGPVEMTSGAVATCLRQKIDVTFLDGHGRFRGRLVGRDSGGASLRRSQAFVATDPSRCHEIARAIVRGKAKNQRAVLVRAQREIRAPEIAAAAAGLRLLLPRIDRAQDVEALRGLEGQAAALYFGCFGACLRNPRFTFHTRVRRPPTDPVNACLSFGYTLLQVTVEDLALGIGFDPGLGFLHGLARGNPSLVLDAMEEFRPLVVDPFVLRLINRRQVAPTDFEEPAPVEDDPFGSNAPAGDAGEASSLPPVRGVRLTESGRRIFMRTWLERLRETAWYPPRAGNFAWRDIVEMQLHRLRRVLEGEDPRYEAYVRP